MIHETNNYARYLAGKKIIDDNSLDHAVWTAMSEWLNNLQNEGRPLRIIETGAGTGTMIERLLDEGLLHHCTYNAVELDPVFRQIACDRLQAWCQSHDYDFLSKNNHVWLLVKNGLKNIEINWTTGDIEKIQDEFQPGAFDFIVGHAVIDLLPVPICLPGLLKCLDSKGGFYFSLNYAGETVFKPAHPDDGNILRAYHDDMDQRFAHIDWHASQTGHQLGKWLIEHGHQIIAEGPSDWQLQSCINQTAITNQFIADILATIENALTGLSGLPEWLALRRQQLQTGQLQFRAANRDYFGLIGNPYMGTRC